MVKRNIILKAISCTVLLALFVFIMPNSTMAEGGDNIQELTGKWDINGNGFIGNIDITNQEGSEFTGTVNYNSHATNNLTNGSIKGNQVSFTRQWVDSSFKQEYTGTLTIADGIMTMKGTFTSSGSTYNWIATKKSTGTPTPLPVPPTPVPTDNIQDLTGKWDINGI